MHDIEPFYNWRHIYSSEEDERSPFYGRVYSEFEFTQTIYNYYIHPQWDDFGSRTMYCKVLMADYEEQYIVLELIGEWNDAIENDIMTLKRDVIDLFLREGVVHRLANPLVIEGLDLGVQLYPEHRGCIDRIDGNAGNVA